MGRQRTRDDDVARPLIDHVTQDVVHVLHDDVDVEVEHAIDALVVRIDEIATDVGTCIGMQYVEPAGHFEDSRQQRRAIPGSSRSMTSGMACPPCLLHCAVKERSSRSTIATRAPAANMASALAGPMPDAAPVTTATLSSSSLAMATSQVECLVEWSAYCANRR